MKNIVLYEHYDGVRFILERSLSRADQKINIQSSNVESEIKRLIDLDNLDLLVTELSGVHPAGLEISRYARELNPDIKIIWITLLGCNVFKEMREKIGNIVCIEKPLEINDFRRDVYQALEMSPNGG